MFSLDLTCFSSQLFLGFFLTNVLHIWYDKSWEYQLLCHLKHVKRKILLLTLSHLICIQMLCCCIAKIRFSKERNKSFMPLKFLHVSDARVPILSSPWSGSEYLPLDFVLVEYKGSPGYMQLILWVNIVECDKNFREKLILPQFKEKAKKKKKCIAATSLNIKLGGCHMIHHLQIPLLSRWDVESDQRRLLICAWIMRPISFKPWSCFSSKNL